MLELVIEDVSPCWCAINSHKKHAKGISIVAERRVRRPADMARNGQSWRNGVLNFSRLLQQIQLMMQKARIILHIFTHFSESKFSTFWGFPRFSREFVCKSRRQWGRLYLRLIFCGFCWPPRRNFPIFILVYAQQLFRGGEERKLTHTPTLEYTLSNFRFNNFFIYGIFSPSKMESIKSIKSFSEL